MCLRNDQVEYVTCKIIIAFGEDNNKTENVRYVGSLVYKAICTAPFTDRYPCTGCRLSKHLQRHVLLYRLTYYITFYIIYIRTNVINRNKAWR